MTITITQLVQRTVQPKTVAQKRSTFIRSASIEKLRKFNNFVCSQHYYLLPGILLWLRTSQSLFKSNVEKCFTYLKTISFIVIIRELIQKNFLLILDTKEQLFSLLKTKLDTFTDEIKFRCGVFHEQLKRCTLVLSVYSGLTLIAFHMVGCVYFISLYLPPIGFFFLIGCVSLIARIKYKILNKLDAKMDDQTKKGHLNLVGKNISQVKLF